MSAKLGEILVRENLISSQQLREVLEYQRTNGGRLGSNLVNLGIISDDVITAVLSRQYGVPSINLDLFQIEPETIKLISQEVALKYSVLPISKVGATLTLAMADPTNVFAMDDIKFMTGLSVEPVIASEASLVTAIGKYYSTDNQIDIFETSSINGLERFEPRPSRNGNGKNGNGKNGASSSGAGIAEQRLVESDLTVSLDRFEFDAHEGEELEIVDDNDEIDLAALAQASEDAPVVRLVNVLLVDSLRRGASDIHVEPYEKDFRIRFRIDGVLYDVMHPPLKMRDALISRLKIMSKLDISEKRLPQDGRIKVKVKIDNRSRELDFRVSTLPTLFGEKVVLRLLDKDKLMLDMTKLGFEKRVWRFSSAIFKALRNGSGDGSDRFG
jgi:type IV pilus assembly protein PilB